MSNKAVLKQELFVIPEQLQNEGPQQDQLMLPPNSAFLRLNDHQYEVTSLSCFDCTARTSKARENEFKKLILAHAQIEGELILHDIVVQKLPLKWIRPTLTSQTDQDSLVLKFEAHEQAINVERVAALLESSKILSSQGSYSAALSALPAEFKALVYELKDLLEHLKSKIDTLEKETPKDSQYEANEFRLAIAQHIASYLESLRIPKIYAVAAQYLEGLNPEQTKSAIDFVRNQVGPLVYGAPFANRAFYKPRGYAGDYEMMNHLYRDELVGKTLFDQCLHKYFVQESAGAAVKNRGYYLLDKITDLFARTPKDQALKILSVASGPAMEQQLFLQNAPQYHHRPAQFTCLDSDEGSLKHAQRQLQSTERIIKSGFEFKFKNMAIRNIIARGLPEQNYDLIYSAGLFDYFTDQVARAAAIKLITSVKSGGRVIIGNFSKDNLSASFMELVLDWHLIYRSEEDLLRIFQGLGSKIWVEKEPLGINLFVVIQK